MKEKIVPYYRDHPLYPNLARLGEALIKDCPMNDCIVYRNVYQLYNELVADYRRIDETFSDLSDTTILALDGKMLERVKTMMDMYKNNVAIKKYRETHNL